MKVCGIIAEYNPFHNGHLYQLNQIRKHLKADYIIVAMSGDFVQRGTPAIFDKHTRTRMALLSGADLVLELPVSIATGSAERFASGGVALLDALGVVDTLCFGSEDGDLSMIEALAEILWKEPPLFQSFLKTALASGRNFPSARARALTQYLLQSDPEDAAKEFSPQKKTSSIDSLELVSSTLSHPNNLLGIEYCKALRRQNSSIQAFTIPRSGLSYHASSSTSSEENPSATYVRRVLTEGVAHASFPASFLQNNVPPEILPVYEEMWVQNSIITEKDLDLLLHVRLLENSRESLSSYMDVSPALADRIWKMRNQYQGFLSFAQLLKTKELTYTRIQRALLHILLKTETPADSDLLSYASVLGFRKEASPLLKQINQNCRVPLLTKACQKKLFSSSPAGIEIQENLFASNLYESLLVNKNKQAFRHEFEKPVVIL